MLGVAIILLTKFHRSKPDYKNTAAESTDTYWTSLLGLVGLMILATGLRLIQLDRGMWLDEIFTYVKYANIPFGELVSTYDSQNHHILYSLFTHASFLIFWR